MKFEMDTEHVASNCFKTSWCHVAYSPKHDLVLVSKIILLLPYPLCRFFHDQLTLFIYSITCLGYGWVVVGNTSASSPAASLACQG